MANSELDYDTKDLAVQRAILRRKYLSPVLMELSQFQIEEAEPPMNLSQYVENAVTHVNVPEVDSTLRTR